MKARTRISIGVMEILLLLGGGAGCGNKFFDPAQIGRFRPSPAVNIILDSLGVAEEAPSPWEAATEPTPEDVTAVNADYVLAPGDVVRVAIYELLMEGQMVTNDYAVNESGRLSIPEVGVVEAAGLTETGLEARLRDILSPDRLVNPTVTVALVSSQRRLCSVVGEGVTRPGRFMIPRHDFRLADALALAGGANQFNVSTIYVARARAPQAPAGTVASAGRGFSGRPVMGGLTTLGPQRADAAMAEFGNQPAARSALPSFQAERRMLGMNTAMTQRLWTESQKVIPTGSGFGRGNGATVISPSSFPAAARPLASGLPLAAASPAAPAAAEPQIEWIFENGRWKPITRQGAAPRPQPVGPSPTPAAPARPAPRVPTAPVPTPPAATPGPGPSAAPVEWVFKDGRWVPVQGRPAPSAGPTYEFSQNPSVLPLDGQADEAGEVWEAADETRLIRIPKDRLMAGDPRYNIVIQPGDTIYVPVDVVGEFYIMGNVNRTGTINMTGRPVTLKQAIAMAGGLGPLAFPKRCEIVRRIDSNREEIVQVDLDKIASGEQPDFFIKPNDTINVGTHYSSRWRAVLRNSFRAAWGFGMVYDRNFADDQFGRGFPGWLPF